MSIGYIETKFSHSLAELNMEKTWICWTEGTWIFYFSHFLEPFLFEKLQNAHITQVSFSFPFCISACLCFLNESFGGFDVVWFFLKY